MTCRRSASGESAGHSIEWSYNIPPLMHNTGGVRGTGGLENTAKSIPRARTVCRASGGVRGRLLRKATNSAYDTELSERGERFAGRRVTHWYRGLEGARAQDAFGVALGRSFLHRSSPHLGNSFRGLH